MYIQSRYAWWLAMITKRSGKFIFITCPFVSRSTRVWPWDGGVSVVIANCVGPKRTVIAITALLSGQTVERHSRSRPYPSLVHPIALENNRFPTKGTKSRGTNKNWAELIPNWARVKMTGKSILDVQGPWGGLSFIGMVYRGFCAILNAVEP